MKRLPEILIGYALNSPRGRTRNLIFAAWHDIRTTSRPKFTSRDSSPMKQGSRIEERARSMYVGMFVYICVFKFLCADGHLGQEGHAPRQTLRHQRVECLDAERVTSTLGAARSEPWQSVTDTSLQEGGGVADFFQADRDAMEAGADFWIYDWGIFFRHHVMPREHLHAPTQSHHSQFRSNTLTSRDKPNRLGRLGREQYRRFIGNLMDIEFSLKVLCGSTRFRSLNKRPHQGYS